VGEKEGSGQIIAGKKDDKEETKLRLSYQSFVRRKETKKTNTHFGFSWKLKV